MRVLLAADSNVIHSQRYLVLLSKAGCQTHLLDSGIRRTPFRQGNVTYHRWPKEGKKLCHRLLGKSLGEKVSNWIVKIQLKLLWYRVRPDINHVQWIDTRAWHFARADLHPLVLTAWGSDLNWTRASNHDPDLLQKKKQTLASADLLISDGEDILQLGSELAGQPLRSLLLPIGIDTQLFRPGLVEEGTQWRLKLKIPTDAIVILSPRALKRNYGHHLIMRAFGQVISQQEVNAYLVFKKYDCGDETYIEEIEQIGAEAGALDRVHFIDKVAYERLPGLYSMANVVINFPELDAFPVTFLECLACQVPIITNQHPSYLSNGIASYLNFVCDNTSESLAQTLILFLREMNGQRARAKSARTFVVKHFDENIIARQLAHAYEQTLAAPPG